MGWTRLFELLGLEYLGKKSLLIFYHLQKYNY